MAKIGAIQSYFGQTETNACPIPNVQSPPPPAITMAQCTPRRPTRMATRRTESSYCAAPISPTPAAKRCLLPGPMQRNPYLNFLREYRKKCCGLSAVETVRQGAKAWKELPKEERQRYIVEVCN